MNQSQAQSPNPVISIRNCYVDGENLTPVSYNWETQQVRCINSEGEVRRIRLVDPEDKKEFRTFFSSNEY